jgi:hypothetical protein
MGDLGGEFVEVDEPWNATKQLAAATDNPRSGRWGTGGEDIIMAHTHTCLLTHIVFSTDGRPDHTHVLASFPSALALSDAVRTVKANSSRWIKEEGLLPEFAWQTGYGAFSIGRSERETVIEYIKNQLSHHRSVTYQDEYLRLLHDYDLEYDPRFLWD